MKVCVLTLGCKVNEAESASIMRGLEARGFETTEKLGQADAYLINTCAVTAEAERKSRQAIARVRRYSPEAPVVVCGCASEHDAEAFARREGVVLVTGAMHKDRLLDLFSKRGVFRETEQTFCELPPPKQTRTRAYLRIQDGCNRFCSYCLIPYLRGRTRSRRAESVLREAAACGAREIVLTGIDISSYRDGETDLGGLLLLLKDVPARIRLGSLEPGVVTERFLGEVRRAENVCPHFHLSLQSGSDAVLRAMNRHYTREEYLAACARIRAYFPEAAITTDIIVGYPTETEEDFALSLSIVQEAGFSRVHAFPFSPRAGTAAAKLPDLPAAVKRERMARMLAEAARAEQAFLAGMEGKRAVALFEDGGGYTENYIRVFCEDAREGSLCKVVLKEKFKDGVRAEIEEEL